MSTLNTLEFLAQVSACIKADGKFISAKDARSMGRDATGTSAAFALADGQADFTEEDLAQAEAALLWIRGYEGNDQFLTSLKSKVVTDDILFSTAATTAWIMPKFQDQGNPEAAKLDLSGYIDTSTHVGVKGQEVFMKLTCLAERNVKVKGYDRTIITMTDGKNIFAHWPSEAKGLEPGKVYRVNGKVKVHNVYDGVKQTVITRCKYFAVK